MGTRGIRPVLLIALCLIGVLATGGRALAIPSFARQTGFECTACHTEYPQLTALGRQFKLNGYTMGDAPFYKKFSAWMQGSFTHTSTDQPEDAAPQFAPNNNFALDQASVFYGGTIAGPVGAFLQGTYDGIGNVLVWDNMDIRASHETSLGGSDLVFGASLNNSPGVQDVVNTIPAWWFPFDSSGLAPTPAASTLIDGGLGQIAVGGSVYAMWNQSIYGEAGLYHTLSHDIVDALDGSAEGAPKSDGVAPYWRFFWQDDFGPNNITLGTFGLHAALYPDADQSQGSDKYTDIGFDAQYQYTGDRDSVVGRLSFIQEFQNLDASFAMGAADSTSNQLHDLNVNATYLYDKTVGFTAGVSYIWGSSDAAYYGTPTGSPDSTSLTLQLDWLPLNDVPYSAYPWFNPKLTAQYVHYFQFDGSSSNVDGAGRSASDNDTLFVLLTFTF